MNPLPAPPDGALLAAWRNSEYRVETASDRLVLRIDQHNPDLAALMQAEGISNAAYITADNPFSRVVSEADNAAARQRLQARLNAEGWRWLPGLGIDPTGDPTGEHSLLVLGIALDDAIKVGREFEQHAILTIGAHAIPRLQMIGAKNNP